MSVMPPHFFEFAPSSAAQWFSAIGTIAAVILALYRDTISASLRKPKLDVTCTKEPPWTGKTPITVYAEKGAWIGDAYYIRARVENTGKTRAENVQVNVAKLEKAGADNHFVEIPGFVPLNAGWSNMKQEGGGRVTILGGISPKMWSFCDLIALSRPDNPYQGKPTGAQPGKTVAHLQLEIDPLSGSNLLLPGKYRLLLRIGASNMGAIEKTLTFTHTGEWKDDDTEMRRDCFGVSLA